MVKILTTMLADDDPAFIGQLIQHSSSKISMTSFPVDGLANVVNTVPKTVRPSTVLTSTVSMIVDDNPIFNARAAIEPFLMKVALQWRCAMHADHGATTATVVWSLSKVPLNSTLSGNITNGIVDDTPHVDISFSTVKVDLATLTDDDPSTAMPIYTFFPVQQDCPCKPTLLTTSPGKMKVSLHSDREKVALLHVKGEKIQS